MTNTEAVIPEAVGDWLLRGSDYETQLAGPVTDSIIDAAALVGRRWKNGFPNWELYRAAIAGDALYVPNLRRWVVAFSVAHCLAGGVKVGAFSENFACIAAWDALHIVLFSRELQPTTVSATTVGVHHKTYRRLRDSLAKRLLSSLAEYRAQLLVAMIEVKHSERKCGSTFAGSILGMRGSCFSGIDSSVSGNGNFFRVRAKDSDDL